SFSSRLSAHAAQRHGGGVLAVVRGKVVNLAGRDLADHDGGPDHVGGALFAFRSSGHVIVPQLVNKKAMGEQTWRLIRGYQPDDRLNLRACQVLAPNGRSRPV